MRGEYGWGEYCKASEDGSPPHAWGIHQLVN